ncbi:GvpL/GvpF family gas vesicle protein [Virgibacillus kekensis]|uniref:GvpL/GvpF family gas vesicle protein n=1 Tax=Virgibacillus kekensis TaxID=202261 RepID=A0ABV9DI14_9BACI
MSNLIYVYGVVRTGESIPSFRGISGESDAYAITFGSVDVIVCGVSEAEYSEEALKEKVNNPEWLHEKAFHHHEAVMKIYEHATVIPMKFGTIYESTESLENKIMSQHDDLYASLNHLADKEEWNFKIYANNEKLHKTTEANNATVGAKKEAIGKLSPGRQYLEKRRLDQLIDRELDKEKESFCSLVHAGLDEYSEDSTVKKNWNKDVTGRTDEMCWNSVYLVKKDKVEDFLEHIKNLQHEWETSGWTIEAAGPWPAYHFAESGTRGQAPCPKSEG